MIYYALRKIVGLMGSTVWKPWHETSTFDWAQLQLFTISTFHSVAPALVFPLLTVPITESFNLHLPDAAGKVKVKVSSTMHSNKQKKMYSIYHLKCKYIYVCLSAYKTCLPVEMKHKTIDIEIAKATIVQNLYMRRWILEFIVFFHLVKWQQLQYWCEFYWKRQRFMQSYCQISFL